MDLLQQEVVAAHLRYGAVAEPLQIRAYAQLAAKALLLAGRHSRLSLDRIRRCINEIVGGANPNHEQLFRAISMLQSLGVVEASGRKWKLTRKGRDDLEAQVERRRQRVASILNRHFPGDLDQAELANWFDDASVAFFAVYGDRWVAAVTRRTPIVGPGGPDLRAIVCRTATRFAFSNRVDDLTAAFKRFLDSGTPEDNEHLWSLGMATFASRLVSAGIGADPISTRELRDSTVLLDTNTLLAVSLEASRPARALEALGAALGEINAELSYVHATLEEYRGVTACWGDRTLKALDRYGPDVLEGSEDVWIRTALGRHCRDREDFERFFAQVADPPQRLGADLPITLLDDPEVAEAAQRAGADAALVNQIRAHWRDRRGWLKPSHVARHDAAVTGVVRHLTSQGRRAWVLTLDLTMHDLALRWAGPAGTPLWVSLDPLLQILAVDHGGTSIDPVQFGPLLARLIANEVEIQQDVYTIEDLRWLDEIHRDVAKLPPQAVKEMAREIHRARISGAKRGDPEVRLCVERAYQRTTAKFIADHEEAQRMVSDALGAKEQAEISRDRAEALARQEIERELRRRARNRLVTEGALLVVAGIALALGIGTLFDWAWDGGTRVELASFALQLLGVAVAPFAAIRKWLLPRHRARVSKIPELAAAELRRRTGT